MKELVLINFVMDARNSLLSHQYEVALKFANIFEKVTVISGNNAGGELPSNVSIQNLNWDAGRNTRNTFKLLRVAIPILIKKRGDAVVFCHMTDVQSAILGPITWALHIRHYLWYAHKHPSKFLLIASKFVDGVVTSTEGSCPIKGKKVFCIGQGINLENFTALFEKQEFSIRNLVHVGRFDASKNISMLMDVARDLRGTHPDLTFTQIGSPSTPVAEGYFQNTILKFSEDLDEGWLQIKGSIKRIELPNELRKFDLFLHAYSGSLDKTLIEATLSGLPVVTVNEEFLNEFGRWNNVGDFSLKSEILFINSLAIEELNKELGRRYQLAKKRHSLDGWIASLSSIFLSEMKGKR